MYTVAIVEDNDKDAALLRGFLDRYAAEKGLSFDVRRFADAFDFVSDLVLPDTFRGEEYGISAYAFYERGDIVSVQIGKGVTFIGNSAFYGCANLASVQIGAGVKDIESNAFAYSGVTQAIIPESVEYVRIGAFSFCADLETVSIGDGTRDIGYYAFANCKNLRSFSMGSGAENVDFSIIDESLENLESISVSADNPFYSGAGNCLVEKKSGTLFIGCKNTVIPDDGSVRAIRAQAFRNCTGLREIVIPDSVESIGANVFLYCDSLESLTVPFIGESRNGANTRLAYFFETDDVPSSLERLTLTDCDSIGSEAFRWCSSLREITLCGSIRTITGAPFSSCSDDLTVYFEGSLSDWMQIEFGGESSNPLSYVQKVYVGGELLAGNIVIPDEITVVKDFAFYNAKGIDSVTFHDRVTSIGRLAFYNCSFTEPDLPADLVSLGQGAFRNCASLTEIVLPAGVTSLPAELFMSCTSLARVTAEGEILSVGSSAFYGCTALRELENVTENLAVVETSTFGNCVSLRDLAFSEKLRSIGNSAFSGCTSLVLGALSEGLKSIGDSAFYECSSLSLTALPAGLESIGEFAFSYCGSLVSLILPDSLESIARRAFYLTDIVRVEFDGDLASWFAVSIAEESYLLSNAKEFYIGGKLVDHLEIPAGVTDINARAFEEYDWLYSVVIPSGVVTIGECAFKNCSNLFRVVLGKDVSSIGSQAFSGCWLLYVVYDLSDHITVTAGSMADGYIGYYAKDVFTSIDDYGTNAWTDENGYILYDGAAGTILLGYTGDDAMLTLPESINGKDYTIAGGCFQENTSIVSVVIPAGVESIGSNAFFGCTKLVSVRNLSELPISLGSNSSYGYVASYAKEVLSDADSASGVSRTDDGYLWYSDASNVYLLGYDGKLEGEITLPADFGGRAYSIYTSAFEGQIDLLGITVPEGVTGIGNNAFADCRNLKYISLPDSLIFVGKTAFVDTALQYSEYAGGKYLGNAANPYLVLVSFADGAATQATVHADAKLIAGGAFKSNRSVTDVALPAGLVSIGDEAFSECTALTRAEIGDSVVYIGDSAFYACSALTYVTIGAGVEQIGREAFWATYALTEVRLYAEAFECGANCFRSAGADGEGLSLFIGANVTRIPDNFFLQNDSVVSKLVSVVFEEGSVCEYIGDSAFNGCEYLFELVLSESLKSIGDSAFLNCRSLTEVVLPDSLESIGTWVFYGCTSMESITLPFIGQNADGTGYAFFGHLLTMRQG